MGKLACIHRVRFTKIREYVTYSFVFVNVHVRSGVVCLVFQLHTPEQLRAFENVRVTKDR